MHKRVVGEPIVLARNLLHLQRTSHAWEICTALLGWKIVRASHNLKRETVKHQYQWVKKRTSNFNNYAMGSHVMQYGDTNITDEKLYLYHGFDPATVNLPPHNGKLDTPMEVVNQRDAEILFMWQMYKRFNHQPEKKRDILNQIAETVKHRINHLDRSMELIGVLFYGPGKEMKEGRCSVFVGRFGR